MCHRRFSGLKAASVRTGPTKTVPGIWVLLSVLVCIGGRALVSSRRMGRRAIETRARQSPRLLARRRPKRLRKWSCPLLGFLVACFFERARYWYSIGPSGPIVRFPAVLGRRRGIASGRAGAAASRVLVCLCLPALVQSGASVKLHHLVPAASFCPTRSRG